MTKNTAVSWAVPVQHHSPAAAVRCVAAKNEQDKKKQVALLLSVLCAILSFCTFIYQFFLARQNSRIHRKPERSRDESLNLTRSALLTLYFLSI